MAVSFGVVSRYFLGKKGFAFDAELIYSAQAQEGEFSYYMNTPSYPGVASRGDYRVALRVLKLPLHLAHLLGKGPVYFTSVFGLQPQLLVGSREFYRAYNYYASPPYEEGEEINGLIYKIAGSKFNVALSGGLGVDIWPSNNFGLTLQIRTDFSLIDIETYSLFLGRVKGYNTLGIFLATYH